MPETNPYDLSTADLLWFNRATQPMRREEDGSLGPDITLAEATEAMRRAGADTSNGILMSELFAALDEVIAERRNNETIS